MPKDKFYGPINDKPSPAPKQANIRGKSGYWREREAAARQARLAKIRDTHLVRSEDQVATADTSLSSLPVSQNPILPVSPVIVGKVRVTQRTEPSFYQDEFTSKSDALTALISAFNATALTIRLASEGKTKPVSGCSAPTAGGECGLNASPGSTYCAFHANKQRFGILNLNAGEVYAANADLLAKLQSRKENLKSPRP